jgi:hypothetical protein
MAEQIEIYQNQAVNFTDTSNGGLPPLNRQWNFSGGSISSATGATATVFYTNPGLYNVSLTVTDSVNTSKTLTKSNLVNVSPAFIISNFTGTPSSTILMSTPINFVDASTGQPQAPNTWAWDIQGSLYVTQNVSFPGFPDWFAIGGQPGDQPGDVRSVTASLTASFGLLSDNESKSFSVAKIGPLETNWINSRGSTGPWVTDSIFEVEMNGGNPLITSDIGYPGSEIIYSIDLSAPSTQSINSFHTTTEDSSFYFTGMPSPELIGLNQSSGYLIIDEQIYLSGQTQIMDGQFITPGLVNKLYFTAPLIDSAYNGSYNPFGYSYSIGLIENVINSLYPQTNSGQATSFNCQFPTNSVYGSSDSPVVPSFQQLINLGVPVPYQVEIDVSYFGGASVTVTTLMSDNAGVGNEIGGPGDWYVMQDTMGGTGVASMLNAEIASSVPGGTGTGMIAVASSLYNTNTSAGPGPTADYAGISFQIKDRNIERIEIRDNSATLNTLYSVNLPPFAYSFSNPFPITCSGMISNFELSTYTPEFGTRLDYGGSIY